MIAAACAVLGLLGGLAYFAALQWSLRLPLRGVAALALLRLAIAGVLLWGVAQAGALPLLAALGGVLAGRWVSLRRIRGLP